MALPQASKSGDTGLGEARVAVLSQYGQARFDDVMPTILHALALGW